MIPLARKMQRQLHDIKIEMKKVHWPTKRELAVFTGVVLLAILIIGVFFWILDSGFTSLLRLILN